MVEFFRKSDITHSSVVSQTDKDLSENPLIAIINSGKNNNAMLLSFDLDDTPPYGEAKATGLSIYMYSTLVTTGRNNAAARLKFYRMLIDVGSNTSSITAQDRDTYVMSSQPSMRNFQLEDFNAAGQGKSFQYHYYTPVIKWTGRPNEVLYLAYSAYHTMPENNFGRGHCNKAFIIKTFADGSEYIPLLPLDLYQGEYMYYLAQENLGYGQFLDMTDEELALNGYEYCMSNMRWGHAYISTQQLYTYDELFAPQGEGSRSVIKQWRFLMGTGAGETVDVDRVNSDNSLFWCDTRHWFDWNVNAESYYGEGEVPPLKAFSGAQFRSLEDGTVTMMMANTWNSDNATDVSSTAIGGFNTIAWQDDPEWDVQNTVAQTYNYAPVKLDAARGIDNDSNPSPTTVADGAQKQKVRWTWGSEVIADGDYWVLFDGDNIPRVFWFEVGGSGGSAPSSSRLKLYAGDITKIAITSATKTDADFLVILNAINGCNSGNSFDVTRDATSSTSYLTITNDDIGYAEDPAIGGLRNDQYAYRYQDTFWVEERGRGGSMMHSSSASIDISTAFHMLGDGGGSGLGGEVKQYLTHAYGSASLADAVYPSYKRSFILWFGKTKFKGTNTYGDVFTQSQRPKIFDLIWEDSGLYYNAGAGADATLNFAHSCFGWIFTRPSANDAVGQQINITPIIFRAADVPTAASNTVLVDKTTAGHKGIFIIDDDVTNHKMQSFNILADEFYNLRVYLDPEESGAMLNVIDSEEKVLATSHAPNNKRLSNGYEDAPAYMTFSTTNIGRIRSDASVSTAGEYQSDVLEGTTVAAGDTFNKQRRSFVCIDRVAWNGFNYEIQNATMAGDSIVHGGIEIAAGDRRLSATMGDIQASDDWGGVLSLESNRAGGFSGYFHRYQPTYLSFGYPSKASCLDGNTRYALFNGFSIESTKNVTSIPDANIQIGFIDNASHHGRYIGKQNFADNATYTYGLGVNTSSEVAFDGDNYIRNFKDKGFINYDIDADTVGPANRDIVKRENHLVAGRIVEIVDAKTIKAKGCKWVQHQLAVTEGAEISESDENTDVFYSYGPWSDNPQTLRIYEYGTPFMEGNYHSGLHVTAVNYDGFSDIATITFAENINNSDLHHATLTGCTIDVSDNHIEKTAHGFHPGDRIAFTGIANATGIEDNKIYLVSARALSANTFRVVEAANYHLSRFSYITLAGADDVGSVSVDQMTWLDDSMIKHTPMFVSPEAFWVIWQIIPWSNDGGGFSATSLPGRKYDSVVPVSSDAGMVGMTWNESSVSDSYATGTLYANKWSIAGTGTSIYEQNTDYGYGVYDEEEQPDGGYAGIDMIMQDVWNPINLDGLITSGDVVPNSTLGLFGMANNPALTYTNSMHMALAGNENPPFLLLKFEDKVPEPITKFTVEPNEDNPFLLDFKWEVEAEDLWYGFMHISNTTVNNQYFDSLVHIPLNEDGTKTAAAAAVASNKGIISYNIFTLAADVIKSYTYSDNSSSAADSIGSAVTNDIEGLAGWCKHFTTDISDNDDVTYNNSFIEFGNADFDSGGGGKNFSLIVHIVPDDNPVADEFIISKEGEYDLWLDTSGQVNANIHASLSSAEAAPDITIPPVRLRGVSVIPMDGDTPTCVMITINTELRANNAKMFINGKLEDQSGLSLITGSPNNWQIGAVIANTTKDFNIGRRNYETLTPTTDKNPFDGKLEEIVIYSTTILPISPENQELQFNPLHNEMTSSTSASSKSYIARLFMKDYHNIRGKTRDDICSSGQISFRKAGFALDTS
tara:strand:- start:5200 stop:10509 length:5310 start_codon:yes stop_codon:yes gene_type:complete